MNRCHFILGLCGLLLMHNQGLSAPANVETVTLGSAPSLTAVLELVADDLGFFRDEGLAVEMYEYPSGKEALDDVMVHKVDFAASTALPVVAMSFKQNDFRIIGTVGILANDNVVVARRNAGIVNVADLKGKRVGTGENIMPHYMLDLLLRKHGLQCNEALVTFAPQSKLVEDLSKGELDAATLLGKYISQASKNLNTNAVIFSDKTLFEIKTYVMVHESFTRKRPQAIDKFLRGCLRAERHIAAHPDESMKIVSRRLKMDIAVVQQAWPNCHFAVEFHQAMLNDIESKARWQIDRCLTTSKTMPNYLNFLNYQALEKIAPQRVTIIH